MPDTMIDSAARERVSALEMAVWGPQGTNGLKSEVRALTKKTDELETAMRHYVDTRSETCLGLKALAEHEAAEGALYDETKEEEKAVRVATVQSEAEKSKARWSLVAAVVTAAFLFAGQVITTTQASATQREIAQIAARLEASK